jgi:hypothetical protein
VCKASIQTLFVEFVQYRLRNYPFPSLLVHASVLPMLLCYPLVEIVKTGMQLWFLVKIVSVTTSSLRMKAVTWPRPEMFLDRAALEEF